MGSGLSPEQLEAKTSPQGLSCGNAAFSIFCLGVPVAQEPGEGLVLLDLRKAAHRRNKHIQAPKSRNGAISN